MKWFYLRDKHRNPVACVVSEVLTTKYVAFAVSTHNPIDSYNRNEARGVAAERLLEGDEVTIVPSGFGVKTRIIEAIAEDKSFPTRTRAAAKLWLQDRAASVNSLSQADGYIGIDSLQKFLNDIHSINQLAGVTPVFGMSFGSGFSRG